MFEEEIKLQKESSYFVPLVLVLVLIAVIVGSIGYWVLPTRKGLDAAQAAPLVIAYLQAQGPATVHFHTGAVKPSVDEKTRDPHYRLLEKAGLMKMTNAKQGDGINVSLTPTGEQQLKDIAGVVKVTNPDDTIGYTAPLAEHKLAAISGVTMNGRDTAVVQFTWVWAPNKLGEAFDAAGPLVKSFNTWDRSTLIQRYGVNFYHAEPAQAIVTFIRSDKGWKLAPE